MKNFVVFAAAFFCIDLADAAERAGVQGKNAQIVIVKGDVVNQATGGATARINLGSVVASRVKGNNHQVVAISGSIVNSSSGMKSKSEINIGSVVDGSD